MVLCDCRGLVGLCAHARVSGSGTVARGDDGLQDKALEAIEVRDFVLCFLARCTSFARCFSSRCLCGEVGFTFQDRGLSFQGSESVAVGSLSVLKRTVLTGASGGLAVSSSATLTPATCFAATQRNQDPEGQPNETENGQYNGNAQYNGNGHGYYNGNGQPSGNGSTMQQWQPPSVQGRAFGSLAYASP
eukprot:3710002-Rhodomonas_salina.7